MHAFEFLNAGLEKKMPSLYIILTTFAESREETMCGIFATVHSVLQHSCICRTISWLWGFCNLARTQAGLRLQMLFCSFPVDHFYRPLHPLQFQLSPSLAVLVHQERSKDESSNGPIGGLENRSCLPSARSFWDPDIQTNLPKRPSDHPLQSQLRFQSSELPGHTVSCETPSDLTFGWSLLHRPCWLLSSFRLLCSLCLLA